MSRNFKPWTLVVISFGQSFPSCWNQDNKHDGHVWPLDSETVFLFPTQEVKTMFLSSFQLPRDNHSGGLGVTHQPLTFLSSSSQCQCCTVSSCTWVCHRCEECSWWTALPSGSCQPSTSQTTCTCVTCAPSVCTCSQPSSWCAWSCCGSSNRSSPSPLPSRSWWVTLEIVTDVSLFLSVCLLCCLFLCCLCVCFCQCAFCDVCSCVWRSLFSFLLVCYLFLCLIVFLFSPSSHQSHTHYMTLARHFSKGFTDSVVFWSWHMLLKEVIVQNLDESYQCLKNFYFAGCPPIWYCYEVSINTGLPGVTWEGKFDLQLLYQCGSM